MACFAELVALEHQHIAGIPLPLGRDTKWLIWSSMSEIKGTKRQSPRVDDDRDLEAERLPPPVGMTTRQSSPRSAARTTPRCVGR